MMTLKEIAERLSVTPQTIRRLAIAGEIPTIRIGRRWRAKRDLFEQWIRERCLENVSANDVSEGDVSPEHTSLEDTSAGGTLRDTVP
jgi:excisionase family DNA binding protein